MTNLSEDIGVETAPAMSLAQCQETIALLGRASPFLRATAARLGGFAQQFAALQPDEWEQDLCARLRSLHPRADDNLSAAARIAKVKEVVRVVRHEHLLGLAMMDVARRWSVARVTRSLSLVAQEAVQAATLSVIWVIAQRRGIAEELCGQHQCGQGQHQPLADSGFAVIAMGKLGAWELNYSSDLDLVIVYSADSPYFRRLREPANDAVRITKMLLDVLQGVTSAGNGWRIDLRLRPDPGATQLAVSREAAENYYASMALTWERAAYIKARAIAGDIAAGEDFLAAISPFVWRRSLDFTAIDEIHQMKRRVDATMAQSPRGGGVAAAAEVAGGDVTAMLADFDIKRGRGGIRDIELFAQTQQLIAAGRNEELRVRGTIEALARLHQHGWIAQSAHDDLSALYPLFRRVEHALQMIEDAQTHRLPSNELGWQRLVSLVGEASPQVLAARIHAALGSVTAHYDALFDRGGERALGDSDGDGDSGAVAVRFDHTEADGASINMLRRAGFGDPKGAADIVLSWRYGRIAATRSPRSRAILDRITPALLHAFCKSIDADRAIRLFDDFLQQLPAGVPLFSLLESNRWLIELLTEICGTAPGLASYLARRPSVLDALIDPSSDVRQFSAIGVARALEQQLARASDSESALNAIRLVGQEQKFVLGVRLLTGSDSVARSQRNYSMLAQEIIRAASAWIWRERRRRARTDGSAEGSAETNARAENDKYAIVAFGRLGAMEMTASSDLDIVVVYESENHEAARIFRRFTLNLISALSAPTALGGMYEVDTRLRPSGRAGPMAVSLSAFTDYNTNQAWTWEIMALLRARVVAASDPTFAARVSAKIAQVLTVERCAAKVIGDAADMRRRVLAEKPSGGIWNVKDGAGGLTDIHLAVQAMMLAGGSPMVARPPAATEQGCEHCALTQGTSAMIDSLWQHTGESALGELAAAFAVLNATSHLVALCLSGSTAEDMPLAYSQRLAAHLRAVASGSLAAQVTVDADADAGNYCMQMIERARAAVVANVSEVARYAAMLRGV